MKQQILEAKLDRIEALARKALTEDAVQRIFTLQEILKVADKKEYAHV